MEVGAAPAAPGLDALTDQLHDLVELGPGESVVRGSPADQIEQIGRRPLLGCHLGDDLLSQDVEGKAGQTDGVKPPGGNRREQGGALDQFVSGQRVQTALGSTGPTVIGTTDPLQERGDAAR